MPPPPPPSPAVCSRSDGEQHNLSWNCGAEGPSDSAAVNTLRQRQVSAGTPAGAAAAASGSRAGRPAGARNVESFDAVPVVA